MQLFFTHRVKDKIFMIKCDSEATVMTIKQKLSKAVGEEITQITFYRCRPNSQRFSTWEEAFGSKNRFAIKGDEFDKEIFVNICETKLGCQHNQCSEFTFRSQQFEKENINAPQKSM